MRRSVPFLWGLVVILLILNLTLLYALNLARLTAIETLDQIQTSLDKLAGEVIVYEIAVNQAIPIRADVPLNQTMEIPLQTTIPIDQELTVPFQMGNQEVEIDMPVKMDFPIDMVVPVKFNETIKVDTVVQLDTTVPVEIAVAKTPLLGYLNETRLNVAHLRSRLALTGDEAAVAAAALQETDLSVASESVADPEVSEETEEPARSENGAGTPAPEQVVSSETPEEITSTGMTESDPAACSHPYWPLQPGATWTYNSPATSYLQRIDAVTGDRAYVSTEYEGQQIQFTIACTPEGLAGDLVGDMRRITELGRLEFSPTGGIFLPATEQLEEIGFRWQQQFNLTGVVQAKQGDRSLEGSVEQGQAVATYTSTGFESVETPLGAREAVRVEQKLELDLNLVFTLDDQPVPATQQVSLTNLYWFAKDIGLVKMHWQGGSMEQTVGTAQTPAGQPLTMPAIAMDQLVFVCLASEAETLTCKRLAGLAQSDLTPPAETELDLLPFLLPEDLAPEQASVNATATVPAAGERSREETSSEPAPEAGEQEEGSPTGATPPPGTSTALLAYALVVEEIGQKITAAGEEFGESALKYRNDEISLEEFRTEFLTFAPSVEALIGQVEALSPPAEASSAHQKLTAGLAKCEQAVDLMDEWFDTRNSDLKNATALLVADCMEEVNAGVNDLAGLVGQDN